MEWKQLRPNETASLARFLETFLSGMETGIEEVSSLPESALKPSLVEWKLINEFLNLVDLQSLETFLSGMETGQAPDGGDSDKHLETFLSGMETRGSRSGTSGGR